MYKCRVEKPDYRPNGIEVKMDRIVNVTDAVYAEWGPANKGILSYIQDLGPDANTVSGAARKLAAENGISLRSLVTTDGKITVKTIEDAIKRRDG